MTLGVMTVDFIWLHLLANLEKPVSVGEVTIASNNLTELARADDTNPRTQCGDSIMKLRQ